MGNEQDYKFPSFSDIKPLIYSNDHEEIRKIVDSVVANKNKTFTSGLSARFNISMLLSKVHQRKKRKEKLTLS